MDKLKPIVDDVQNYCQRTKLFQDTRRWIRQTRGGYWLGKASSVLLDVTGRTSEPSKAVNKEAY